MGVWGQKALGRAGHQVSLPLCSWYRRKGQGTKWSVCFLSSSLHLSWSCPAVRPTCEEPCAHLLKSLCVSLKSLWHKESSAQGCMGPMGSGQRTSSHPPPHTPPSRRVLWAGGSVRLSQFFELAFLCSPLLGLCLCLGMCLFWKRNLSPQTRERLGSCLPHLSHHFLREVFAGFQKVSPLRCSQHCASRLLAAPTPPLFWNFVFVRVRPREVLETPVSPGTSPT